MESQSTIPDFACSRHPNEIIKRVSIKTGMVYCLECILTVSNENKNNLVSIDKFFETLDERYSKIIRVSDSPSDSIKNFIEDYKTIYEEKIKGKIEEEKLKAIKTIESVQASLNELFEKQKLQIIKKLDDQAEFVKSIYETYKKTVDYYFRPDERKIFNKDAYLNKVSRLQSSSQVESLFSKTVDEFKFFIIGNEKEDLGLDAISDLKFLANYLQKAQEQAMPCFDYNGYSIKADSTSIMNELSYIKNEFPPLTPMNLSLPDLAWMRAHLAPGSNEYDISVFDMKGTFEAKIGYFQVAPAGTTGILIATADEQIFVYYKINKSNIFGNVRLELTSKVDQTISQNANNINFDILNNSGKLSLRVKDNKFEEIKEVTLFTLKATVTEPPKNKSLFNNNNSKIGGSMGFVSLKPVSQGLFGGHVFYEQQPVNKTMFNNKNN